MTLRQYFDEKLEAIRSDVLRMGGIASDMVRLAVDATLNGDTALAERVIQMDDEVDRLDKETVHATVFMVMRESPVASDLLLLVSVLGVIGEIEKVADDAVKLARRATKLTGHFPGEMKVALSRLGDLAGTSFASALRLVSNYDASLASQVIRGDKQIDGEYVEARNAVFKLIQANPNETEHLVRTIEAFHALEHVADHSVEIASRLQLHYQGEV